MTFLYFELWCHGLDTTLHLVGCKSFISKSRREKNLLLLSNLSCQLTAVIVYGFKHEKVVVNPLWFRAVGRSENPGEIRKFHKIMNCFDMPVNVRFQSTAVSTNFTFLNGFFFSWNDSTCFFKWHFRAKVYSHTSHWKGFFYDEPLQHAVSD